MYNLTQRLAGRPGAVLAEALIPTKIKNYLSTKKRVNFLNGNQWNEIQYMQTEVDTETEWKFIIY